MRLKTIKMKSNTVPVLELAFNKPLDDTTGLFTTEIHDNTNQGNDAVLNTADQELLEDFWLFAKEPEQIYVSRNYTGETLIGDLTFTYGSKFVSSTANMDTQIKQGDILVLGEYQDYGAEFGGSSDYLSYNESSPIVNDFGVFVTVALDNNTPRASLVSRWGDTGDDLNCSFDMEILSDKRLLVTVSGDGTNLAPAIKVRQSSVLIENGDNVGFTFKDGVVKLYINGVIDIYATVVTDGTVNTVFAGTGDFTIGRRQTNLYDGRLKDVRYVNNATKSLINWFPFRGVLSTKTNSGDVLTVTGSVPVKNIIENTKKSKFEMLVDIVVGSDIQLRNKYYEPEDYVGKCSVIRHVKSFSDNYLDQDFSNTIASGKPIVGGWDFERDEQIGRTVCSNVVGGGGFKTVFVGKSEYVSINGFDILNNNYAIHGLYNAVNKLTEISNSNLMYSIINTDAEVVSATGVNCTQGGFSAGENVITNATDCLMFESSINPFPPSGASEVTVNLDGVRFRHNTGYAIPSGFDYTVIINGFYFPTLDILAFTQDANPAGNAILVVPEFSGKTIVNENDLLSIDVTGYKMTDYIYRLNSSSWSSIRAMGTPIILNPKVAGVNNIEAYGKYIDGYWGLETDTGEFSFFVRDALILKYSKILIDLLPQGAFWNITDTDVFARFITSWSTALADYERFYQKNKFELMPQNTTDYLAEWEEVVGLPGDCQVLASTVDRRRNAVLAKLRNRGGNTASKQYIVDFYKSFGYEVEVRDYPDCTGGAGASPFLFEIWSSYSGTEDVFARASEGPSDTGLIFCDSPLATFGNGLLNCIGNKIRPAHTELDFKVL